MLKLFKKLDKKAIIFIILSIGFIMGQVWLDLKMPDYMQQITILLKTPGSTISDIMTQGGYMLLCCLGSLLSSFIVGYFAAKIGAGLAYRLRGELFDKVQSFSMDEINNFSIPSLITRSTNDITQIQMIFGMGLQIIIKAPILAVWAILKIAGKSWQWTTATGVAVAILLIMLSILGILVLPKFKKIQTLTDNLNEITRENLTGVRVVRAYNAEKYQETKFSHANDELTHNHLFTSRAMGIMMPGMTLLMSGLSLSIYWIGALIINQAGLFDKLTLFSEMMVFSAYAMQVVMAFMLLSMISIVLPRAAVSARRIGEVLATEASIVDGDGDTHSNETGNIVFKDVCFRYNDAEENILENINFTAKTGETVAFIGSTGSGKSTLINLIPRFYDASSGEVLVDGVNVRDYKQEDLHRKIGYVSQKAVLFSGTVNSNVNFGDNNASYDTIKEAVDISQSKDFVEKMEKGYDSTIAQGGLNVSGGQKQRLSIARAIARKPEIIIFDDSFSALDYKTDKTLRHTLDEKLRDTTKLIVAQRIGTIKSADQIIVLDEGKIVGKGKHQDLLRDCEVYKQIALSQLTKEELEDAR